MIQFLFCKHLLSSRRNQNISDGRASGSVDKTKDPEGRALVLEGRTEKHAGSSQALNHDESFPVGFWTFKSMR